MGKLKGGVFRTRLIQYRFAIFLPMMDDEMVKPGSTHKTTPQPRPKQRRGIPTFAKAIKRYIAQGGEEKYLIRLEEYFGPDTPIDQITDASIAKAAEYLHPNSLPSTRHRQVTVPVKAVLNLAYGTGRRKRPPRDPAVWLKPEEAERLLAVAAQPERIGLRDPQRQTLKKIAFMLGTGAYPVEVFALTIKALDRDTGAWTLPGIESLVLPRTILPPARATSLIGRLPTSGAAFLTPSGEPYVIHKKIGGQMADAFNQVRDAAGLGKHITPAILRKTWAVWFYAQTQYMTPFIEMGGWAGPRSAKPYVDIGGDDLALNLYRSGWDFRDSLAFHLARTTQAS